MAKLSLRMPLFLGGNGKNKIITLTRIMCITIVGSLHIKEGLYMFKMMTGLHKYTQKVSTTIVDNAKTLGHRSS